MCLNKAHISERKFREILKCFAEDETAFKSVKYSGVNRNTVNILFQLIHQRIVKISVASTPGIESLK